MLYDARKQGLDPIICSSYRTKEYQEELFSNKVNYYLRLGYTEEKAKEEASYWVTIPRTSEHEAGLAVDIVSKKYQILDKNQENTQVQKWLIEHCSDYFLTMSIVKEASNKNNNGVIIIGMLVVIVGLVGYTMFKNKK